MKNKKAYTLAETMLTMLIWAFVAVLTLSVFKGAGEYIEKIKLKNVTLEFKHALDAVVTNPYYYPLDSDLANLDEISEENALDATNVAYKGKNKFRSLLLKELNVSNVGLTSCYIMIKDKKVSLENCYKGTNNVLWGIPDTDFDETNIVLAKNPSGSVFKYVPVTIYPDVKNYSSIADFNAYAIVYGVRRDGDVTIINNVDCTKNEYKTYNQCRLKDFISPKK